ncbi:MAG: chemotaxis protein CheW [Halapricum sp.]
MREGRRGDDGDTNSDDEEVAAPEVEGTDTTPAADSDASQTEAGSGVESDAANKDASSETNPSGTNRSDSSEEDTSSTDENASMDDESDESEWFAGDDESGSGNDDDEASADGPEEIASSVAAAASEFEVEGNSSTDEIDSSEPTEIEGPAATSTEETEREEEIRVLEFRLGDEQYCLDIRHVEEIVKEEAITRVPNTPEHVRGVVDLRGQITTILDPKVSLGIEETDGEKLIVVFDEETFEDQGHAGWIVDEVRQVMPITESEVKESPLDQKAVKGVVERDGEFVIWAEPEVALLDE